ncbi:MAG: hypothetical protein ACREOO_12695 [bacterium]
MDNLQKALRLILLALFLTLLIGISNLPHKPVLWVFIALFVAARAAEIFHPAAESLAEWHRSAAHPRWLAWLSGLTFITNVALPILDHRYRGEVFWASPLPVDPWWSWAGLLGLLAGAVLRWQTFSNVPKPQKPAPSKTASKRRRNSEEDETEIPKYDPQYLAQLHQHFSRAAALAYLGTAVLFTSMWGLLALAVIVLPTMLFRRQTEEHAVPS